ncbi:hypothetical protein Tco_1312080 [Tanacetum coccineum]
MNLTNSIGCWVMTTPVLLVRKKSNTKPPEERTFLDAFDDRDADLAHDIDYIDTEEAVNEGRQSKETEELNVTHDTKVLEKGGSNEEPVNAAGNIGVDEDIFLADALEMLSDKAKLKGVENTERRCEKTTRFHFYLEALLKNYPKDTGKGVLKEEPEPVKVKSKDQGEAQIERDAEIALKMFKLDSIKEHEKYYCDERAKLLAEYTDAEHDSEEDERKTESMNKEDAVESTEKDSDLKEEEHLKTFLKIIPDEEGIIDFEALEKRFLIINWESKFYHFDRHRAECIYYRIFRSDKSSRWIKTFFEMVTRFDRLDLLELYNLVMQRIETTTPEGVDLVLWGDLRTMLEANAEDELWQNQEGWNLKSWDLYENCRVHTLTLEDGTEIHMLVERRYPLTKETLERMMSLKLIAESASDSAFDLLRFIQKQIDEAGSYNGGEKDL